MILEFMRRREDLTSPKSPFSPCSSRSKEKDGNFLSGMPLQVWFCRENIEMKHNYISCLIGFVFGWIFWCLIDCELWSFFQSLDSNSSVLLCGLYCLAKAVILHWQHRKILLNLFQVSSFYKICRNWLYLRFYPLPNLVTIQSSDKIQGARRWTHMPK